MTLTRAPVPPPPVVSFSRIPSARAVPLPCVPMSPPVRPRVLREFPSRFCSHSPVLFFSLLPPP